MRILYDSKKAEHKSPFGCLNQEQPCQIMIKIPESCRAKEVYLVLENEGGEVIREVLLPEKGSDTPYENFSGTFYLSECGLYFYYFKIIEEASDFLLFKENARDTNMNSGAKWQLSCLHKDFVTPETFRGNVMYQIFPDRFYHSRLCDAQGKLEPFWIHEKTTETPAYLPDEKGIIQNNDFYGGNLQGIIKKLPYLSSLHVQALYLNPIFKAYSNHRYDTCDYKQIDPLLGTEKDFIQLCEKAHGYGMKIILDMVFSHTGDRSIYFDRLGEFRGGAYHDHNSAYRGWYQFDEQEPSGYRSWWGITTLPCTDELNDDFLDYIIRDDDSVIVHWLRCGADGYRLDVADELPDEFIAMLYQRVKQINPEAIVVGEVWEDASNKVSYGVRRKYFTGMELDATMNYPFKDAIIGFVQEQITSEQLCETIMSIAENYPKCVLDSLMNSLSTHDIMRILTVLGVEQYPQERSERAEYWLSGEAKKAAIEKLKLAAFLQFTLPGSACIYYGDEAGAEGFEDPFNRRYFPWDDINVELWNYHASLAAFKTQNPALQIGDIKVTSDYDGIFVFHRFTEGSTLAAVCCMRDFYDCFADGGTVLYHNGEMHDGHLILHKYGCALLRIR